jgi:hypothetical protein
VPARQGLHVEVQRELRPGRLSVFAGFGTRGDTYLDLGKHFGRPLV